MDRGDIVAALTVMPAIGAFATDLAFFRTGAAMWAHASSWLIVAATATAVASLVMTFWSRRGRALAIATGAASAIALLASFLIHLRDGAGGIVPLGMILSAIAATLVILHLIASVAIDRRPNLQTGAP